MRRAEEVRVVGWEEEIDRGMEGEGGNRLHRGENLRGCRSDVGVRLKCRCVGVGARCRCVGEMRAAWFEKVEGESLSLGVVWVWGSADVWVEGSPAGKCGREGMMS